MANIIEFDGNEWVVENFEGQLLMGYQLNKKLYSGKSDFQQVDVLETKSHGRMLYNDNLAMLSERDEFVYHEMISHLPLFIHPNPKRVLIIGGGDGGTAREVLRHKTIEKCVMVEIDKMVVDSCREFIPKTSKDLDHPKLELRIEDGLKYVAETEESFDVILVDSTDPIGPAQPLFGPEFYGNIHKILNEDGIVVSQGESCWYMPEMQKKLLSILNQIFPIAGIYNFNNLTYPGGLWSFTFASKKYHPLKDFKPERIQQSGLSFEYYNEQIHRACFSLPEFMKKNLQEVMTL